VLVKKAAGWAILAVVVVVVFSIWRYASEPAPPIVVPPVAEAPPPVAAPAGPDIRHPLPKAAPETTLPHLGESDRVVKDALAALWGERTVEELLYPNELVRRFVATIDNLPRPKVALRVMSVKPAPGAFKTTGKGDDVVIAQDNAARYRLHVQVAKSIDSAKLVSLYVRFYPLFQQAYEELGYPGAYFNDRLVEVIDHLLAAPQLPPQAKLVRPKVFYKFADPGLEASSAGHKILMRIGNENAAVLKAKLAEIRGELVRRAPRPGAKAGPE